MRTYAIAWPVLAVLLGLGSARAGDPAWRPVPALEHEPIYALAASGDTLWAGTETAVRRSLDGGLTWPDSGMGLAPGRIMGLARSGKNLAAAQWRSLYASSDAGLSWTLRDTLDVGSHMRLIQRGDTLIVYHALFGGPEPDGMRVSLDGGLTWREAPFAPMPGLDLAVFRGDTVSVDGNALLRGSGATRKAFLNLPDGIAQVLAASGRLFAVSRNGLCLASSDGSAWSGIRTLDRAAEVRGIAAEGEALAIHTLRGIYFSGNWGREWRFAGANRYAWNEQRLHLSAGRLFVSAWGQAGLYRFDPAKGSWDSTSLPSVAGMFTASGGSAAFAGGDGRLSFSQDQGSTFKAVKGSAVAAIPIQQGGFMAMTRSRVYLGYMRGLAFSADSGRTWSRNVSCPTYLHDLAAMDSAVYLVDLQNRLTRTTDAVSPCLGALKSIPVPGPAAPERSAFLAADGGTLYYGTPKGVFAWETEAATTGIAGGRVRARPPSSPSRFPVRVWERPQAPSSGPSDRVFDAKGAERPK